MNTPFLYKSSLVATFLWLGAVRLHAQPVMSSTGNLTVPQMVKDAQQPKSALSHPIKHTSDHEDIDTLRKNAVRLRQVAGEKPNTPEARKAAVDEVRTLTRLAHLQDSGLEQRRHELVEKLKKDEALTRMERAKLAILSANVDVQFNRSLDPGQRMVAFADVAWKQLQEFPEDTENYAALLRIARDSSDAQAKIIAEGLLRSGAPAEVKQGAQVVLSRVGLVGKSLQDILRDDVRQLGLTGSVTIFTWSSNQPAALGLAKTLKQSFPSDTAIIAICLDKDPSAARTVATNQKPEAQLVFPDGGHESLLCKKLLLDGPAVYRINSLGVITTVSGLNQLTLEHWKKSKEGKK